MRRSPRGIDYLKVLTIVDEMLNLIKALNSNCRVTLLLGRGHIDVGGGGLCCSDNCTDKTCGFRGERGTAINESSN